MYEILPSDKVVELFKTTASKDKVYSVTTLNMTSLYNWYVDNIGKTINHLHEQGNSSFFKFLVEYFIITQSINTYFLYQEGYEGVSGIPVYDIEIIISFIENSNMPSKLGKESLKNIIYKLYNEGVFDHIVKSVKDELYKFKINWATLENYDFEKNGFILPMKWSEVPKDIATYINDDMYRYKNTYKYNRAVYLDIVLLDVFDIDKIGVGTLEELLLRSVQPIDTEILKSYVKDE